MSRARSTRDRMARAELLVHERNRQMQIKHEKQIHAATKCIGASMCMAVHMCEGECAAKSYNTRERSERDTPTPMINPMMELQTC